MSIAIFIITTPSDSTTRKIPRRDEMSKPISIDEADREDNYRRGYEAGSRRGADVEFLKTSSFGEAYDKGYLDGCHNILGYRDGQADAESIYNMEGYLDDIFPGTSYYGEAYDEGYLEGYEDYRLTYRRYK